MMFLLVTNLIIFVQLTYGQTCNHRDYGNGGTVCVCSEKYCDFVEPLEPIGHDKFTLYTSNKNGLRFHKIVADFETIALGAEIVAEVYQGKSYQTIKGWGGAFTDATGINVNSLPPNARSNLLRSYFSPYGIEYSLCRVPIGGTDFSTHAYSYDDVENDINLKHFQLALEDYEYKIPLIKEAQQLTNGRLRFFGSSWTVPKWIKSNGKYTGFGTAIKYDKYQVWANYFIKFLDAYKQEGIPFWGITTQNEPSLALIPISPFNKINSVGWTPNQMSTWISKHLGPTLRGSQHSDTKIMCLDDQRLALPWFVDLLFKNKLTREYVDGIAVHWYFNSFVPPSVLSKTHESYPEKFILGTEASESEFSNQKVLLGSWQRGEGYAKDIIDNVENWVSGWTDWNMALDVAGGPTYIANYLDSPIIVNNTAGEFYKQPMFYAMGHFSKFVPPGSKRIHTEQNSRKIGLVAFKRPDDGIALVILNRHKRDVALLIKDGRRGHINLIASKRSINTIIYW